MIYLLLISLLWAFSFGLIKDQLTGLDPVFVAFVRLFIAFLVFLPFFRWKKSKQSGRLLLIGGIQFGLMYLFYIYAYQWLMAYQVALFTVFTPIYVTLSEDILKRKFNGVHFLAALLSVIGTAVIVWKSIGDLGVIYGFLLVQASNICFALGQIFYRKVRPHKATLGDEAQVFAALYLGAIIITGLVASFGVHWDKIVLSQNEILSLMYLGILASGFGFFLWNYGAKQVNAGTLAVFNNLKIPLAVLVALLVFGEQANLWRLLIGGTLIVGALWYSEVREVRAK